MDFSQILLNNKVVQKTAINMLSSQEKDIACSIGENAFIVYVQDSKIKIIKQNRGGEKIAEYELSSFLANILQKI